MGDKDSYFEFYSIKYEDSIDTTDAVPSLIFLWGANDNFCCMQEAVSDAIQKVSFMEKLYGVTPEIALFMTGDCKGMH